MKPYRELSKEALQELLAQQRKEHAAYKAKGLKLNMTRGKPSPEQCDLSLPMLDVVTSNTEAEILHAGQNDDVRNYGGLTGLPAARELMASIMGVDAEDTVVCGNSSLSIMYDLVSQAVTHGLAGQAPWSKLPEPARFLCPVPGYDRHFALTEHFGISMIPLPMTPEGPDMDQVERHVNADPLVKGIWCVPKYANPTGITYSENVVRRLAALLPAAKDFRIYWDNAYAVHDLAAQGEAAQLLNIKDACDEASHPHHWYQFASTSKITFAGSGIAALASSEENLKSITKTLSYQTIGPDKINQKRHTLFLPNPDAVHEHMAKHAALLRPKFDMVEQVLTKRLVKTGIGTWSKPQGGYFISFDGPQNTARRTVELAAQAGVVLTAAGATFPYGEDPLDANLRIAPTYPGLEELETAVEVFTTCVRIAALEQLL